MAEVTGAGEGAIQRIEPVKLEAKAQARDKARKARGKKRYCRLLPVLTGPRRKAAVPCLRTEFNPEDFRMAREIVERYCPPTVPRAMKRYIKGPLDLFNALLVYVLVVEFGWSKHEIADHIGRGRKAQDEWVAQIEDARDGAEFIEQICQRAQEYCRGLL